MELLHSLLPRLYERAVPAAFAAGRYASTDAPNGPGNLLTPTGAHKIDGG